MCRAVYTEDNILYDAEILSVDTDNETCVVCYVGYGNEEEKKLSELKVMSRKSQKQNMTSDLDVGIEFTTYGSIPSSKNKSISYYQ